MAIIRTYPHPGIANVDCARLKDAGFAAWLEDEHYAAVDGLMVGAIGYIKLHVPDEEQAEALVLLEQDEQASDAADGDVESCPKCASTNFSVIAPWLFLAFCIPLLFPLMFVRRKSCHACGHRWK